MRACGSHFFVVVQSAPAYRFVLWTLRTVLGDDMLGGVFQRCDLAQARPIWSWYSFTM